MVGRRRAKLLHSWEMRKREGGEVEGDGGLAAVLGDRRALERVN
jgi:hypothetical protein